MHSIHHFQNSRSKHIDTESNLSDIHQKIHSNSELKQHRHAFFTFKIVSKDITYRTKLHSFIKHTFKLRNCNNQHACISHYSAGKCNTESHIHSSTHSNSESKEKHTCIFILKQCRKIITQNLKQNHMYFSL